MKDIEKRLEEVSNRADRFMAHFGVQEERHLQIGYYEFMKFIDSELSLQRQELLALIESKRRDNAKLDENIVTRDNYFFNLALDDLTAHLAESKV